MITASRMLRNLTIVIALIASAVTVSVARPALAAAAYPHCNGRYTYSGPTYLPVYFFGFSPVKDCILVYGDGYGVPGETDAVKTLQDSLILCNRANLGNEWPGKYGPKTEAAVRWIQASAKIPDDGDYGPQTRKVMFWWTPANDAWYCHKVS